MSPRNCYQGEYERFERIWHERKKALCATPCGAACHACLPQPWVAARILGLHDEHGDRPLAEMAPMVKLILEESRFAGEAGDIAAQAEYHPPVQRQLSLVMATLQEIRRTEKIQVV